MWKPSNEQLVLGGSVTLAFATGAVASHIFTKKQLKTKYEQIAEQEIAEAKKFYSALNEKPNPIDLAQKYDPETDETHSEDEDSELSDDQLLKNAIVELGYLQEDNGTAIEFRDLPKASQEHVLEHLAVDEPGYTEQIEGRVIEQVELHSVSVDAQPNAFGETITTTEVTKNIFTENEVEEDDFNYDEEVSKRTPDRPYILSHDEYFQGEKDYEQISLTYFEEDDVLVDERDSPIPDTERTVGNANLLRFGHGSKDNNIVYVRNDRLEVDFEVVRSTGSYAKEVLGFIKHSDEPARVRRFRSDDG